MAKKHFYLYPCLQTETERGPPNHDNHDIFPRISPLRDPLSPSTQPLSTIHAPLNSYKVLHESFTCKSKGVSKLLAACNTNTQKKSTYKSKIKWFYSVETQKQHTIISTLVWLHVPVFSRPSSGQYFAVEGTVGAHYTLWDPILFTGCA